MGHVYQKGDGWAISFIDENGTRIRRKVAPDKKTAQAILESYMGRVARQEHLGIIEDDAISFADFADEWLKKAVNKLRPNTRDKWTRLVRNHLKPFFSGALRAVTASKVGEYTAKRIEATWRNISPSAQQAMGTMRIRHGCMLMSASLR